MDQVRPLDVTMFAKNGMDWVKGRSGGISTVDAPDPTVAGTWWRLPAGTAYDDNLLFLWNDFGNHWSWEPSHDMPVLMYRTELASINARFIRV